MSGTNDPSDKQSAAQGSVPNCAQFDSETPVASKPNSDREISRDSQATLIMRHNLNAFLHRTHGKPAQLTARSDGIRPVPPRIKDERKRESSSAALSAAASTLTPGRPPVWG
jgi:hypothetical protein